MAKQSWYSKQIAAEAQRNAAMAARFRAMSDRELVAELTEIENDERAMRLDRRAPQANWERLATRHRLVRAELAARRSGALSGAVGREARKPFFDAYWSARMSDGAAERELAAAEAALDAFDAQHGDPAVSDAA